MSAANVSKTLAEEARLRGQSTTGMTQAQAAAEAERLARQVDQGAVPGHRQGLRPPKGGRKTRRRGRKTTSTKRRRATRSRSS